MTKGGASYHRRQLFRAHDPGVEQRRIARARGQSISVAAYAVSGVPPPAPPGIVAEYWMPRLRFEVAEDKYWWPLAEHLPPSGVPLPPPPSSAVKLWSPRRDYNTWVPLASYLHTAVGLAAYRAAVYAYIRRPAPRLRGCQDSNTWRLYAGATCQEDDSDDEEEIDLLEVDVGRSQAQNQAQKFFDAWPPIEMPAFLLPIAAPLPVPAGQVQVHECVLNDVVSPKPSVMTMPEVKQSFAGAGPSLTANLKKQLAPTAKVPVPAVLTATTVTMPHLLLTDFDLTTVKEALPSNLRQRFNERWTGGFTVILDAGLTATNETGEHVKVYVATSKSGQYLQGDEARQAMASGKGVSCTAFLQRRQMTNVLQDPVTGALTEPLGQWCARKVEFVSMVARNRMETAYGRSLRVSNCLENVTIELCRVAPYRDLQDAKDYCRRVFVQLQAQCGHCMFSKAKLRVVSSTSGFQCSLLVDINPHIFGLNGTLTGATFLFTELPPGTASSGAITKIHRDPDWDVGFRCVSDMNADGGECVLLPDGGSDIDGAPDRLGSGELCGTLLTVPHCVRPITAKDITLPAKRGGVITQTQNRAGDQLQHLGLHKSVFLFLAEELPALKAEGRVLLSDHDIRSGFGQPSRGGIVAVRRSGRWMGRDNQALLHRAMCVDINKVAVQKEFTAACKRRQQAGCDSGRLQVQGSDQVVAKKIATASKRRDAGKRTSLHGMALCDFEAVVIAWAGHGNVTSSLQPLLVALRASQYSARHSDRPQIQDFVNHVRPMVTQEKAATLLPAIVRSFLAILTCTGRTRPLPLDYQPFLELDEVGFLKTFESWDSTIVWLTTLTGRQCGEGKSYSDVFQASQLVHGPWHTQQGKTACKRCTSGAWAGTNAISKIHDPPLVMFSTWMAEQKPPVCAKAVGVQIKKPQFRLFGYGPLLECHLLTALEMLQLVRIPQDYLPEMVPGQTSTRVFDDLGVLGDMRFMTRVCTKEMPMLLWENAACKMEIVNRASRAWPDQVDTLAGQKLGSKPLTGER